MKLELTVKQDRARRSEADITIFGGGNQGGKTTGLMLCALQGIANPKYRAVLFMESLEKIKQVGGILDESRKLYSQFQPALNRTNLEYRFSSGALIKLSFVGQPGQWDGAQFAFGGIDQVEQVDSEQFFAVVSRNRSTSGERSRIFCSCNPSADGEEHWLTKMLDQGGFLQADGFPDPEMDGALRYFVRDQENDAFIFGDSAAELLPHCETDAHGEPIQPYSFTFVQALVDDNQFGDPDYKRKLAVLSESERLRRLKGKWKGLNMEGSHFKAEYFPRVCIVKSKYSRAVRDYDNAWASSKTAAESQSGKETNPDWTVGVRMSAEPDSRFLVEDAIRFRGTPAHIERAIFMTAEIDGPEVEIRLPLDPGAAQAIQAGWANKLGARGYTVHLTRDVGDKLLRAQPYIACAQRRQIKLSSGHITRDVAHQLLDSFDFVENCFGCQECGKSAAPRRCDGSGVVRITIPGLREPDVSSLDGWQDGFVVEHVRFGRKVKGSATKLKGKKDQVDAAVAAYSHLTDPELIPVEHIDPDMPGLRELAASARGFSNHQQRRVTGFGSGARHRPLRG